MNQRMVVGSFKTFFQIELGLAKTIGEDSNKKLSKAGEIICSLLQRNSMEYRCFNCSHSATMSPSHGPRVLAIERFI